MPLFLFDLKPLGVDIHLQYNLTPQTCVGLSLEELFASVIRIGSLVSHSSKHTQSCISHTQVEQLHCEFTKIAPTTTFIFLSIGWSCIGCEDDI